MAILGFLSTSIIDSTSVGRALLTAANAAAQRTLLGLGTGDTPTFTALVLAGQSLTGSSSTSLFDASTTWNTTGTPTAWKLNVTDTASNAQSLLMDLRVGGISLFNVKKDGTTGIGTASPSQKLHVDGNIRVTGAYYDSTNSAGTNGQVLKSTATGTDWVDPYDLVGVNADYVKGVEGNRFVENLQTGVLYGGVITINALDNSKVDISAGVGVIVSPGASTTALPVPTVTTVTWTAKTAVTLTYLTTSEVTWFSINNSGNVVQSSSAWSDSGYQTELPLGIAVHPNNTSISFVKPATHLSYGQATLVDPFVRAFGPLKLSGNTISAYSTNLQISRSSGTSYSIGSNYVNDPNNPNIVSDTNANPISAVHYYFKNGSGGFNIQIGNLVDPTKYDNGSGTLQTVSGGKYTIQRIFSCPTQPTLIGIYYGSQQYTSIEVAEANIPYEVFSESDLTSNQGVFCGYLIVKSNTTNLSNTADAKFIQAGLFRSISTVTAGGQAITSLDDLTDVVITSPVNGNFLRYNSANSSWVNGTGVDGTGTTNYVSKWNDSDTLANSLIFDNGTNVGIGTASPSVKLDVNGGETSITSTSTNPTLILTNTTASNDPYIRFKGPDSSPTYAIGIDSSDSNKFKINGGLLNSAATLASSNIITITEYGLVGLGTTNPGAKLEVNGATYFRSGANAMNIHIFNYDGVGSEQLNIGWGSTGSNQAIIDVQKGGAGVYRDLVFKTSNTERVKVAADGIVDIKNALRLSGSTSGYVGFAPAAAAGSTTYTLPSSDGSSGHVLSTNGSGSLNWVAQSSGSVSSVALSLPGIFSVSGSPVTSSGTLTANLTNQNANLIFAGPNTGSAAAPSFRSLVAADLPNTAVTAGSYTNSNITVDAQGRITSASNGTGGGGTPGGSTTQVQFNSSGAFAGSANFTVDTAGSSTALVNVSSPSNTKPASRFVSNGASQTAAVVAVTDQNIDVFRVMRDGTINDATWGGNTITVAKGGTGLTTLGTAGQQLRVNSGASGLEWFSGAAFGGQSSAVVTGTLANGASVDVTHASDPSFVRIPKFEIQRPVDDGTVLLLNCNGTNGSTTFTDVSLNTKTVTANGNAQVSTAQSRYGGSSALFDGNSDYLSIPYSSDFDLPGDFTIQAWVRFTGYGSSNSGLFGSAIISRYDGLGVSPNFGWQLRINGTASSYTTVNLYTGLTDLNWTYGTFNLNQWYHVCVTRSGSSIRAFVDGTQVGSTTTNSDNMTRTANNPLWIGGLQDSGFRFWHTGYLDDVQVIKGRAIYTGNFTAPTSEASNPYPSIWQTVKLSNTLISDSDCVDVQYGDSNGNNPSTTTRFTNRLGSTVTYRASVLLGSAPAGMFGPVGSEKTSSYTATAFQIEPINLASVGSDVTVSAPATPAEGDWFGYYLSGRNINWKATLNRNGNTVNGDTTTANFTLQERGDHAVWRYLSGTWVPVQLRRTALFATPLSITGCQLWLDASDSSTLFDATTGGSLVAADGAIARWEDRSGNGRHFTQSTSGNRPLRKTAIQNSRDIVRFDGTDDWMSVASSTGLFNYLHDGDSTVFIVFKPGTTSDPNTLYFLFGNNLFNGSIGSQTGHYLRWDDRAARSFQDQLVWLVANNGFARYVGETSTNSSPANTYQLISIISNPQDATIANRAEIRRNGGAPITQNTSLTDAVALASGNATQDMQIARGVGSSNNWYLNGDIAELIFYDSALSTANRTLVENYLKAKWNL